MKTLYVHFCRSKLPRTDIAWEWLFRRRPVRTCVHRRVGLYSDSRRHTRSHTTRQPVDISENGPPTPSRCSFLEQRTQTNQTGIGGPTHRNCYTSNYLCKDRSETVTQNLLYSSVVTYTLLTRWQCFNNYDVKLICIAGSNIACLDVASLAMGAANGITMASNKSFGSYCDTYCAPIWWD